MKAHALSLRFATATLILFAATSGCAQETASARAFVRHVYAGYSKANWRHEAARQTKFYSRSLNRMIVADAEHNPGEISNLDFDPVCDCQDPGDPGELKVELINLTSVPPKRIKAITLFTIATEPRTVTLFLLKTASGWRIDDISSKNMPSLRRLLARPDTAQNRSCASSTARAGIVRGRLAIYNGGYPNFRLWWVGTRHLFGIYSDQADLQCQRGNGCGGDGETTMPNNIQAMFTGSDVFQYFVYGNFKLRLLEPRKTGHMQAACIVSADHVVRRLSR